MARTNPIPHIGKAITDLATQKGLTQQAVAEAAGIPHRSFSRKVNHRPETFTAYELGGIAAALDITLPDLLDRAA